MIFVDAGYLHLDLARRADRRWHFDHAKLAGFTKHDLRADSIPLWYDD